MLNIKNDKRIYLNRVILRTPEVTKTNKDLKNKFVFSAFCVHRYLSRGMYTSIGWQFVKAAVLQLIKNREKTTKIKLTVTTDKVIISGEIYYY